VVSEEKRGETSGEPYHLNLGRSIGSCEQATQSRTGSTISDQEGTASGKDGRFENKFLERMIRLEEEIE
jgi:hypothetical protein